jgi:putative spermidine/putrescine transport system permease protein
MLGRTLWLGFAVTSITLLLGVPTAYLLARSQSRWANFLLLLTTFPLLVSAVVRSFGWMVLFFRDGLLSRTLLAMGFVNQPVQTMYTMTGVIIALAQVLLPLMILTLHGVFKSIDRDLEYAAMSLGARPSVALGLVTFRLASGGIVAGSLLVFSLAISAFATPSLVGGARANVMATAIYEQAVELLDWPFAAALAAILLVVVLAVSLAYGALLEGRGDKEASR